MVGNSTTVTAAPAGTPAPTVQKPAETASLIGLPGGKVASATGGKVPPEEPAVSLADVERAVQRLRELASSTQRNLHFQVDEVSGRTVITVLDAETNEIVRQIPPPEFLAVVHHLEQSGSILDLFG